MNTLYIDRKHTQLGVAANTLELRVQGEFCQRIPLNMLRHVVIVGHVETDTGSLGALAAADISVALLSGRQHRQRAMLLGPLRHPARRRLAQYRACMQADLCAALARAVLLRKLAGQQRLLQQALRKRPENRYALRKGIDSLRGIRRSLTNPALSIEAMRGLEGAAAASYFQAWKTLLPDGLGFSARRRRPPPDPVNAALSLGYSLLYGEAVKAVHAAGLDPALGCLHEPAHGRESLAADLMEPLRPRHDACVWRLFAERRLVRAHFDARDGGYWLNKQGRAVFFGEYETMAGPARRWLRLMLRSVVKEMESYPYE